MRLKNSDGTPIDPVPFLVVALLGAMILIAWGPLYLKAHGINQTTAVAASVALTLLTSAIFYYRFIWAANPMVKQEVPAATRYLRFLYGIVIGILVLLGLIALLYLP